MKWYYLRVILNKQNPPFWYEVHSPLFIRVHIFRSVPPPVELQLNPRRLAHFTNLMKTFCEKSGEWSGPIVSVSLTRGAESSPDWWCGLAGQLLKLQLQLKPNPFPILSVGCRGMGWACINNLCPPLKIIDQVCLFAVVAFNLLAAEVPRLKRQLNCSSCHSAFAALPFGEADKSTKKPGPWD